MVLKIIAVDDEKELDLLFFYFFKKEIREKKVIFSFVTSGEECLRLIEESNADIDYILSDINMPNMDGFTLLNKVKNKYPHIKFFIVSAYESSAYLERAKAEGAADYILKPIDFPLLKEKLGLN